MTHDSHRPRVDGASPPPTPSSASKSPADRKPFVAPELRREADLVRDTADRTFFQPTGMS